eukprot:IDg2730t1
MRCCTQSPISNFIGEMREAQPVLIFRCLSFILSRSIISDHDHQEADPTTGGTEVRTARHTPRECTMVCAGAAETCAETI